MCNLKRTQFYGVRVVAGVTKVVFGGWEMPIKYPAKVVANTCTPGSFPG